MAPRSPLLLSACVVLSLTGAAGAQEYMMPWERAAAEKADVTAEEAQKLEIESGKMEILRLPPVDLKDATIISSHPEVAELHVEQPNLLFVFGHQPGDTRVVIADADKDAVWAADVTVYPPGMPPE